MSNALAIAHVTQALALLLASHVGPEFDEAVKVEPHKPPTEPPDHPTINVFLYQVAPNTSMRGNDLPTRASDGTLVKRPAAALDLHYLITAYGDETTLVGQRLIGSVVRTLHEIPVLPKDVIEETGHLPHLLGSDLAQAVQRVRFTPAVMDIDETSKLWGMLYQTPYSLSVVYQASLILIDGRETPVPAKPVERPEVRVLPFGAPGAPQPPVAGDGDGASGQASGRTVETADGPLAETPAKPSTAPARASGTASGPAPAKAPVKASAKTAARTPARGTASAPAKTAGGAPAKAAKAPAKTPARGRKSARAGGSRTGGSTAGAEPGSTGDGTGATGAEES